MKLLVSGFVVTLARIVIRSTYCGCPARTLDSKESQKLPGDVGFAAMWFPEVDGMISNFGPQNCSDLLICGWI